MGSRKSVQLHKKKKKKQERAGTGQKDKVSAQQIRKNRLEIVLKCDTTGCLEAIVSAINSSASPEVGIDIISSGVGAVNKSDVFMAETGSRLILGFNVGIMPHLEQMALEHNVEIRLFEVIYKLLEDLESIAKSLIPHETAEEIIGSAKVIALFKSSRKGIIIGCEILKGKLMLRRSFRILGAMGPMYTGMIESLHIEKNAVREATKGQQVGLKIKDFNRVKIGDLVESFQVIRGKYDQPWQPQGKIFYP